MKFQRYFFQQYWLVFLLFFLNVCWAESSAQDLSCENATSKLNHTGRIESTVPPLGDSGNTISKRFGRIQNPLFSQRQTLETEFSLQAKGYRPIFTDGLDEINRMIELAQKMRTSQVDPFNTHISEFADAIPDHIEFIKKGITAEKFVVRALNDKQERAIEQAQLVGKGETGLDGTSARMGNYTEQQNKEKYRILTEAGFTPKERRQIVEGKIDEGDSKGGLRILDNLQKEALERLKNKSVTYEWWLTWNAKLVSINHSYVFVSPVEHIPGIVRAFPVNIFLPLTAELGVMALNRSFSQRVFPIGLINELTGVDGLVYNPTSFFSHDVSHAQAYLESFTGSKIRSYLYKIFDKMNLSLLEREMVETVYFLIKHERTFLREISPSRFTPWNRRKQKAIAQRLQRSDDMRELLPNDLNVDNLTEIEEYLDKSVKVFRRVNRQVFLNIHD